MGASGAGVDGLSIQCLDYRFDAGWTGCRDSSIILS